MFYICKHCNSKDIDICPYDDFPFYCNCCDEFMDFNDIENLDFIYNDLII